MTDDRSKKAEGSQMGCPRRIELIQAATRDLNDNDLDRITTHAASCPRCSAIMQEFTQAQEEFLTRHPFEANAPKIVEEADRRLHRQRLVFRLVPAAAAAMLLVVMAFVLLRPTPPTTRIKGEVSLDFFVQKGDQAVHGKDGGTYLADDRIQFTYSSGPNRYLFLVSLDEQGRVSNFNYRGSKVSVQIVPGNDLVLEGSIILDDSVGPERVFAVFSAEPLHEDQVRKAALEAYQSLRHQKGSVRELDRLPLPYPQASILLMKR